MSPGGAVPARGFVPLYTLAYCGLFVAFIPFVSILLQVKVDAIDPGNRVALLGWAVLAGSAVASVANIAAGWLSDLHWRRSRSRRLPIAVGLVLIAFAFLAIHLARTPSALLGAIAFWQVALNLMFAPMVAVMADEVPDRAKGRVSGLLGISHPIGVLSAAAVTAPLFAGEAARFAANVVLATAMIVPFLLFARERGAGDVAAADAGQGAAAPVRADLVRAWVARLAMQVAGNGVTAYAFFHFADRWRGTGDAAGPVAQAMAIVTAIVVVATILAGRWSDRVGGRKPFLGGATLLVVAGLIGMAVAPGFVGAAIGYGMAQTGLSVFLALHAALAMQLLPSADTRGRDLAVLNLTNTLPACVPPLLAALVPAGAGLGAVFVALALVAAVGGGTALAIRSER
ncbi:MFS transporter [Sphingomonas sp. 2R-10]|uniref:MFS transporter n=1 Tax=Sphingomonas sp. 2R-10 TaxID=3045148 RepID=UPI000F782573|nr:MFS transporter [Sphingomonas sp. 2R-10]MDJ0276715.1 MFS transporter [Sphingomonas sp. 2R-10]